MKKTPSRLSRIAILPAVALALSLHAPLPAEEKPATTPHMQLRAADALRITGAAAEANGRADAFSKQGRNAEAEKEYREAARLLNTAFRPAFPDLLKARSNLARVLHAQGKHAEVETEYRTMLASQERDARPQSHEILRTRKQLAEVLSQQGKHVEAEKEYRTLLATRRQKSRAGNVTVFAALLDLAQCLSDQGRGKEALDIIEPAETEFVELWGGGKSAFKTIQSCPRADPGEAEGAPLAGAREIARAPAHPHASPAH